MIDPTGLLLVDQPLAAQHHMNVTVAVASPRLANLLEPVLQTGLLQDECLLGLRKRRISGFALAAVGGGRLH